MAFACGAFARGPNALVNGRRCEAATSLLNDQLGFGAKALRCETLYPSTLESTPVADTKNMIVTMPSPKVKALRRLGT